MHLDLSSMNSYLMIIMSQQMLTSQQMMMAAAVNEQGERERVETERGAKDAHEAVERKFIGGGGGLSELAPEFVPMKS